MVAEPATQPAVAVAGDFITLCRAGRLPAAFTAYHRHIWSDPSLFSHLLQASIPSLPAARRLHSLLLAAGAASDKYLANHLLHAYSKSGDPDSAAAVFRSMPRRNVMTHNILIGGLVSAGDMAAASKVFDGMADRNVATWNAMVAGLIQHELNEEGLDWFRRMRRAGFRPDEFTVASVLWGCAGLRVVRQGWQVHGFVIKSGLSSDVAEEEEKEQSLAHHSEKLAVAFALKRQERFIQTVHSLDQNAHITMNLRSLAFLCSFFVGHLQC